MAPPRIQNIGSTYHVNGKAVDGAKLFTDESDRLLFLRMLSEQAQKSDWCILGYTLMTNHYHLLLKLRKLTLSSGFQRFNSIYARAYNRRQGRRGALWQSRFWDSITETEGHFYETVRYIAYNAPRASLCVRPEDWPWCSYGAAVGLAPRDDLIDEKELLGFFGARLDVARRRLRAYVEEADPRTRFRQTHP